MKQLPSFYHVPPQEVPADPERSEALREALALLRANRGRMLGIGVIFAALAFIGSLQIERMYKSSEQIMIERPIQSPIEFEQQAAARIDTGYVDGQVILLSSPIMLERVVIEAGLLDNPVFASSGPGPIRRAITAIKSLISPSASQVASDLAGVDLQMLNVVKALDDAVTVFREGDTNVVSIEVRLPSPVLAQRVAATLVEVYIDDRLAQREAEARSLSDWIDERAAELRDQLAEAERAATDYRVENNLVGMADAEVGLNDQQLTELNAELIRSQADLAQTRAAYEQAQSVIEGGDAGGLPAVQNSPTIMALRNLQMELQRRLEDASREGTLDTPRVKQLELQIDTVEEQIRSEIALIATGLRNQTEALESRTRLLSEALANATGQAGADSQSALRLRELERIVEAYQVRYERYLGSVSIANELGTFATSGTQIISLASLPLEPYSPPTKVLVILAFILGMVLTLIQALVSNALKASFESLDEIETVLGLRVISALPELQDGENGILMLRRHPYSAYSEGISVLRQSLLGRDEEIETRHHTPIVLLTSAEDKVGKTTAVSSLGESLATHGKRVLVIDGDLRFAGLSELYKMDGTSGLCEILCGNEFLVGDEDTTGKGFLDVIPAGNLQGRPTSVYLESPHLRDLLRVAAARYDLVIIDGPPVANLADCLVLARYASSIVLVMRAGKTTRVAMQNSLRQLPARKMSGVVVTGTDPRDTSGAWVRGGTVLPGYLQLRSPTPKVTVLAERTVASPAVRVDEIA